MLAGPRGRDALALAQLSQERLRPPDLAGIHAAFQETQKDRGVARRVGGGGGSLDAAQKTIERGEVGDVLEERTKAASRGAHLVQALLGRLLDEAESRALQRVALVGDGRVQPLHRRRALMRGRFDGGVSGDLREATIPT